MQMQHKGTKTERLRGSLHSQMTLRPLFSATAQLALDWRFDCRYDQSMGKSRKPRLDPAEVIDPEALLARIREAAGRVAPLCPDVDPGDLLFLVLLLVASTGVAACGARS